MNEGTWPRAEQYPGDEKLRLLYVELDSIEIAIVNAYFVVERKALVEKRAEVLGDIKKLERERHDH